MDASFKSGRDALLYVVTVLRSIAGVRPEAISAAQLDLGDWYLSYGKTGAAVKAYRSAYQTLIDAGFSSEKVDVALAVEMPPRIPLFATHLYTRRSMGLSADAQLEIRGHIDVSYIVDNTGNAHEIRFLDSSTEHSDTLEKMLELQLRSMKFRPELAGGQLRSPGEVDVRYYYSY
jgi:hypothetical protein